MAKVLTIDWSKEESLGLPEGRYLFKVVEADTGESQRGDQQIVLTLMVVAPKKHKGLKQKVWLTLSPRSLRFVRQACEAILGKHMPKSAAKLNLESFIGKMVYAEAVKNGDYTNIQNWEAYSEADDDDDDDDNVTADEIDDEDADLPFDTDDDDEDEDLDFDEDEEDEEEEEEPQPRRRRRR